MSRCSRVWGMTPSSAAMTKITPSMPVAPATMVLMKCSWPGTSTMPTSRSAIVQGQTQFDGHAAFLFLLEEVGVAAGKQLDQGGLAVIDGPAVPRVILTLDVVIFLPGSRIILGPEYRSSGKVQPPFFLTQNAQVILPTRH